MRLRLRSRWRLHRMRYGYGVLTCCLILAVLAVLTHRRNNVWHSPQSLWTDSAEKSPHKVRVLINAGFAMKESGDNAKAQEYFERAIKEPANDSLGRKLRGIAQTDLGYIFFERGDYQHAFDLINSAYSTAPTLETMNAMALMLLVADEPKEAADMTDAVLRQGGREWRMRPSLWATRGQAFQMVGDCFRAMDAYVIVKSLVPTFQIPHCP